MRLSVISEFINNLRIQHVDNESDCWADADAIARESGLYVTRSKELTFVALDDAEEVVGAVWVSICPDQDERLVYDFDVAVRERNRNPTDKVGLKLIDAAINDFKSQRSMYDGDMYIQVQVVNHRLARVLQRYGFEIIEGSIGATGPVYMVYGVPQTAMR
jgi:hypothetical protein